MGYPTNTSAPADAAPSIISLEASMRPFSETVSILSLSAEQSVPEGGEKDHHKCCRNSAVGLVYGEPAPLLGYHGDEDGYGAYYESKLHAKGCDKLSGVKAGNYNYGSDGLMA